MKNCLYDKSLESYRDTRGATVWFLTDWEVIDVACSLQGSRQAETIDSIKRSASFIYMRQILRLLSLAKCWTASDYRYHHYHHLYQYFTPNQHVVNARSICLSSLAAAFTAIRIWIIESDGKNESGCYWTSGSPNPGNLQISVRTEHIPLYCSLASGTNMDFTT